MSAYTLNTVYKAIDKYSPVIKKMEMQNKRFGQRAVTAFTRAERAERKMRKSITKSVGKLGVTVGIYALAQATRAIVGVFADFEQANAGLAAVMGRTVEENKALTDDAKRLGSVTAKTATEVVGLQESFARLGFAEDAILNMTEATISGSIAMKAELSDTADLVGAMVNSFDGFGTIDAPQIIDQMTLATQKSALSFEKLQAGLPIVAGAANSAGVPFTNLLALMGKLSDAGIDTSSSATALRNIFIDSAAQGHTYTQVLENIEKNQSKLTAASDEFGKRAAVSAVILAKNIKGVDELDAALQAASGTAETAANKQLNTLQGRFTLLGSAWEGFVLNTEDGTGALNGFLKTSVGVVTEILNLASGTAKLSTELTDGEIRIRKIANVATFMLKTLKWLAIAFTAGKVAMFAYNVALGITGGLSATASTAIAASGVAMKAYKISAGIATAAQWLLNASLYGFPLVWIVVAIAALIAGIILLVKNWSKLTEWVKTSDNVFAKFIRFSLIPVKLLVKGIGKAFEWLKERWNAVKEAFKTGGFLAGIKTIGKSILSFLLKPIELLLQGLSKIPGIGDKFSGKLQGIQEFRASLEAGATTTEGTGQPLEPVNTTATQTQVTTEKLEKIENQRLGIELTNRTDKDVNINSPALIPVTTNTY